MTIEIKIILPRKTWYIVGGLGFARGWGVPKAQDLHFIHFISLITSVHTKHVPS